MPSIVLVTEPEFRRAERAFASFTGLRCVPTPAPEEELAAAIAGSGARHVVVGSVPYRGALYVALPKGSVIARFGVGYDGIDLAKASAAGVLCTNTPDVLTASVAELTMLLVGTAARRITDLDNRMRQGDWQSSAGAELAGKTIAIIGCGRIGRAVARLASRGFGMRVVGCGHGTARRGDEADAADLFDPMTHDFAVAVRDADFVSLHIPTTRDNVHFVNRERLSMLRRGAWLVNTARGAVVDEAALFDALAAELLGGAALDVFEREPYVPVDPTRDLRSLSCVILTPHVGSHTVEANRRMAERALRNIMLAEAGNFTDMDLLNRDAVAS